MKKCFLTTLIAFLTLMLTTTCQAYNWATLNGGNWVLVDVGMGINYYADKSSVKIVYNEPPNCQLAIDVISVKFSSDKKDGKTLNQPYEIINRHKLEIRYDRNSKKIFYKGKYDWQEWNSSRDYSHVYYPLIPHVAETAFFSAFHESFFDKTMGYNPLEKKHTRIIEDYLYDRLGLRDKANIGIKELSTAMFRLDPNVLRKYDDSVNYETDFLDAFVPSFQHSSGELLTAEQARKIGKEMIAKLAQVDVLSASLLSGNDDEAVVKITFDKFDSNILVAEPNVEENKMLREASGDNVALQEAMTDLFVNRLKKASKSGIAELVVKCKYDGENHIWVPVDLEKFAEDLYSMAWDLK